MDLLIKLCNTIISIIIGWFLNRYWLKLIARRPYAKVLGITSNEKVHIILPHRPYPVQVSSSLTRDRSHVTFEDMLAANYAERSLTLAGLSDHLISINSVNQYQKDRSNLEQQNLILICSPKANNITLDALQSLNGRLTGFNLDFKKVCSNPEEWGIVFDNAVLKSDSYEQISNLISKGIDPEEGTQNDYGILARVNNPWNKEKKLIIIAGIRGIGTWGAARCLRENAKQLVRLTKGKNFVCIVKVTYDNYKMINTELTNFLSVLRQ